MYNEHSLKLFKALWVNQAWATAIAKAVVEEYSQDFLECCWYEIDVTDIVDWLDARFEECDYDEYE
jgi:hypothetical protein